MARNFHPHFLDEFQDFFQALLEELAEFRARLFEEFRDLVDDAFDEFPPDAPGLDRPEKLELKFRDDDGAKVKIELKQKDGSEFEFKFKGRADDGTKIDLKLEGDSGDVISAFVNADALYFTALEDLNDTGVEAVAFMALNGSELTVLTAAEGVAEGKLHPQHIHGFDDDSNAVVPPPSADDPPNGDADGFIELGEGAPFYGPVQISLEPFPTPADDSFLYVETFDLDAFPVTAESLDEKVVVLHGAFVPDGISEDTAEDGYLATLPIAAGEIEMIEFA